MSRRYLIVFTAALLAVVVIISSINYFVDPYAFFEQPRRPGWTQYKPMIELKARVIKPFLVESTRPTTLIIGNSRPEMGLNPTSACWLEEDGIVYNFAMPGTTLYQQVRSVQHAIAVTNAKQLLMGIDVLEFVSETSAAAPPQTWKPVRPIDFDERIAVDADGKPVGNYGWVRLRQTHRFLVSLDAFEDSLTTVFQNTRDRGAGTRTALGFNPSRDYSYLIRTLGQAALFNHTHQDISSKYAGRAFTALSPHGGSSQLTGLKFALNYARQHGVRIRLFMNPYHAEYLYLLKALGLWGAYEDYKRNVTQVAEAANVRLIDFGGFDETSLERMPAPGDTSTTMKWYWEASHYNVNVGELMLARLLDRDCAEGPQGLGSVLTSSTVDDHIAKTRRDLEAYARTHPEVVKRIDAIVAGQTERRRAAK